jgi:hypothetical protein
VLLGWLLTGWLSCKPQVDLPKPLGLKFARGADGGAYVTVNDPQLGNTDPRIQVIAWAAAVQAASGQQAMSWPAGVALLCSLEGVGLLQTQQLL